MKHPPNTITFPMPLISRWKLWVMKIGLCMFPCLFDYTKNIDVLIYYYLHQLALQHHDFLFLFFAIFCVTILLISKNCTTEPSTFYICVYICIEFWFT